VQALAFASDAAYAALSGCPAGAVLRSTDDGESWSSTLSEVSNARSIATLGGRVYVGADSPSTVYVTTDGARWTRVGAGLEDLETEDLITMMAATADRVFLRAGSTLGERRLYRLDGEVWGQPAMRGVPGGADADLDALATDGDQALFIAVWNAGLFLSTDGGDSFVEISDGLPADESISRLLVVGNTLYIGTSRGRLFARSR
jgi:hypothetical protein